NGGAVRCLDNVNIIHELKEYTDLPIEIENDANCALLAEKWIGNAVDSSNFICITIGTGIGGAIYINDKLVRGHNFFSGEFGYMIVEDIYEKFRIHTLNKDSATVPFIKHIARDKGLDTKEIKGNDIFEMIEAGDIQVIEAYKRWIRRLAICIYNLGFILDPQKILIGGGISSQPKFISDLKWEIESISIELLPEIGKFESLHSRCNICACKNYNDSGKIGAVYNFIVRNEKNKI
ncbi:MAG: ROK family protein, partial [Peptostreptococcaceae bacterium]